jgi:hypothetical protein
VTVKQPVYTPSQGIRGSDPIINAAEDLMSLAKAPSMDSAMQAADSALDAAISVVGSMTSPIQAAASVVARLALEYVYPLNMWMNQLTGDSAQVNGIGVSWQSVSESLSSIADELESSGQSAMANMSGASVSAYLMRQGQVVNATRGVAGSSSKFGNAVVTVANLVKKAHDLICAVISELVGIAVDAAVTAPATFGATLLKACKEIMARAKEWASQIKNILTMIKTAFDALKAMVDMIGTAMSNLTSSIREVGKDCVDPGGGCCGAGESSSSNTPETPTEKRKPDILQPAPEAPKKKEESSFWDRVKKAGETIGKLWELWKGKKSGGGSSKPPEVKGPIGPSSPWPRVEPPAIGILPEKGAGISSPSSGGSKPPRGWKEVAP